MSGDISDQASDRELFDTELAVKYQRGQNKPIKYTGRCLYCNEQITIGRFCNKDIEDCSDRWEFEQKMRGIMGR
jgi:hypothetical protein